VKLTKQKQQFTYQTNDTCRAIETGYKCTPLITAGNVFTLQVDKKLA